MRALELLLDAGVSVLSNCRLLVKGVIAFNRKDFNKAGF